MSHERSRRRFALWLLPLIPASVLLLVLIAAQFPIWSAPYAESLPADLPAKCAAVAAMRAYDAVLSDEATDTTAEIAVARARSAVTGTFGDAALRLSTPFLVRGTFAGESHRAWSITAVIESDALVAPAAVIYIEDATAEPLAVIYGLDDPASSCSFNARRAIRDAITSVPFLLFAGYIGLTILGGIGWSFMRRVRRRRGRNSDGQ